MTDNSQSDKEQQIKPQPRPGAYLLESTARNADYWLKNGRNLADRNEAVLAIEQAINAWKGVAYGLAEKLHYSGYLDEPTARPSLAAQEPTALQWQDFYERVWDSDESNPTLSLSKKELQRIGRAMLDAAPLSPRAETLEVPFGMKCVPTKPTPSMLEKCGPMNGYDPDSDTPDRDHALWYTAMVEAAPTLPYAVSHTAAPVEPTEAMRLMNLCIHALAHDAAIKRDDFEPTAEAVKKVFKFFAPMPFEEKVRSTPAPKEGK